MKGNLSELLKKALFLLLLLIITSCQSNQLQKNTSTGIIMLKPFSEWTLEECDNVIEANTATNFSKYLSYDGVERYADDNVMISALPLTEIVLKAVARKEALLKRMDDETCFLLLDNYLHRYTNSEVDPFTKTVKLRNQEPDSIKGLSFWVSFENNTNPYKPIQIEDGYEYFFLENVNNEFARVQEVSGRYADTYFDLSGFLTVTVTFFARSDEGKFILDRDFSFSYFQITFNGLGSFPIKLMWISPSANTESKRKN